MFKEIRRKDRALEGSKLREILKTAEYGFLSLGIQDNGYGYGIPITQIYSEDNDTLYFHCANDGVKIDMLKSNDKVSFCAVGATEPLINMFSTIYESVIVFGECRTVTDDAEKMKALMLFVDKFADKNGIEKGRKYSEKSLPKTTVLALKIEHITGKAKYARESMMAKTLAE